jgi:hypothetical protein
MHSALQGRYMVAQGKALGVQSKLNIEPTANDL